MWEQYYYHVSTALLEVLVAALNSMEVMSLVVEYGKLWGYSLCE
jgi:hypothetical protein